MKTVVSIPDPIFESAEELAAELGISRDQLYASAIQAYVQARTRSDITEALNRVYEKVDPERCLEEIASNPLRPKMSWEALRGMTREP